MNLQSVHVGCSMIRPTCVRLGRLSEHLFAQLAGPTTLDTVQVRVNSAEALLIPCVHMWYYHLLVRTVDGDIEHGILCNITEAQASMRDKLLRLESSRNEHPLFVTRLSLL